MFVLLNDPYSNHGRAGQAYFDRDCEGLALMNSPVPPPTAGMGADPGPRTLKIKPWKGSMALRICRDRTAAAIRAAPRLARIGLASHQVEAIPRHVAVGRITRGGERHVARRGDLKP